MNELLVAVIVGLNVLVLGYFLLLNGGYLATTIASYAALRRHAQRARVMDLANVLTSGAPPITLIAPAYNEEATCVEATTALLSLVYPEYEVIVVNDGSRDGTLARLIDAFDLEATPRAPTAELATAEVRETYRSRRRPNLWVIDKENGGKADALNTGINYCASELFCAMDADTLLERDALARVVRPFLEDARTMAVGGIIRIVNDSSVRIGIVEQVRLPRRLLARFQVLEYLRAFLAGRVGWDVLNALLIISGAFGLFRRSLVVEIGGYATDTVGEDMELVVRIHRHCREQRIPYRVTFIPDPVAWTECPESLRVLGRQRDRWQRGLVQVLWRHRVMLLNPRYGRIGMLGFPYFFFLEGWGPLIELAGYVWFALAILSGWWSPVIAAAFFALAFVFGVALSLAAIGLEELSFRRYERSRDLGRLILVALLEPFGYRLLSTWWRVKGVISAMRGVQRWGAMERRGFKSATVAGLALPLALGALAPASGIAQDTTRWAAGASYAREVFASQTDVWTPWETLDATLGRRFGRGSVALTAMQTTRFRRRDAAAILDAYRPLWPRAYGNLRTHVSPGSSVIARFDVAGEVFQTVGRGWEPSVGYRYSEFPTARVHNVLGAVARYHGWWYARLRAGYAWRAQGSGGSASGALLVRRYFGSSAEHVELGVGTGGEAVTLAAGAAGRAPVVDVRRTSFVVAAGRKFFTPRVGASASLGYTAFEEVPARTGARVGIELRW